MDVVSIFLLFLLFCAIFTFFYETFFLRVSSVLRKGLVLERQRRERREKESDSEEGLELERRREEQQTSLQLQANLIEQKKLEKKREEAKKYTNNNNHLGKKLMEDSSPGQNLEEIREQQQLLLKEKAKENERRKQQQLVEKYENAQSNYHADLSFGYGEGYLSPDEQNRRLKQQQDLEYQNSLKTDQEIERKQKEQEQQHREQEQKNEEVLKSILASEPKQGQDAVTVLFRLVSGAKITQKFHPDATLHKLFLYVSAKTGLVLGKFHLVTPFPRKVYSDPEAATTLLEEDFSKQTILIVETAPIS
eukprot:TRINITY_DN487_c0_g5_i1.p1 TRINITY_DN487_c0_g5~~TRINITY_DN487_c0_g5_i1.p1  ORF type:complete len:320 (-),score=108.72 TRINITY_DN487_c0_g5_i1:124-1041(-)